MPVGPMGEPLPYPGEGDPMAMAAPGGDTAGSPSEMYASLRDLLNEIRLVEQDEQDLLDLEKIGSLVQGLLARNQKEATDAMAGKLSPRMLAQAYGGA